MKECRLQDHCFHDADPAYFPHEVLTVKCCKCGRIMDNPYPNGCVWAFPDEHMGVPVRNPKPDRRA